MYLGGRFQTSLKVGDSSLSNITSNFNYDAFIVRLDTAGKYVWGKAFSGYAGSYQNLDYCYGVGVDNRGNIGVSGRFGGTLAKFGKDTLSGGGSARAIYTSLLDSTGDFIWTIRGTSTTFWNNQANGIALDTSKNIYVTGIADPPMVFESKVFATGAGFRDAYILKIADCSESIKAKIYSDSITSVCAGDSVKLWSNNNPSLEYRWLLGGGAFGIYLATDSTYLASKTDNYALAISDEGCLDTSSLIKVTINKPTKPTINTFPPTCAGDPDFTITSGVPAGGKYSGIGVKNDTVFSPATSGIGSFNINYVYTDTNGCVDSTNKNLPVGGQSAFFTLVKSSACKNEATFAISGGNPSGGTYTGPGVTSGSFNPGSVSVGIHKLGYVYSALGCSDTAYQNITVNAAPAAGFSSVPIQCASTFSVNLATYRTPAGGVLSGTGIIGTTFYPIISGAGSFTISYITAGSCKDTATRVIVVEPVPSASVTAFSNRCANASAFTLTGGAPVGGVYLYNGNAVTSFNPLSADEGVYTIKYAFTNSCGTDTASRSLKIDSLPGVTLSALSSVCAGSPAFALTGGNPASGTYSGAGVNSTTGIFTPSTATAGTHAITYSFTDGNSCSNTATQNIVVNAQPIVTLGNFVNICANASSLSLSGGVPLTGAYSGLGVSTGSFNPNLAGKGLHTITYKFTNANSCTDSASSNILVDSITTLNYPALINICGGSARKTINLASPIGGLYRGVGVVNDTLFDPSISGTGTFTIRYVFTNSFGCKDSIGQTIGVDTIPSVSFAVQDSVCINNDSLTLTGVPNGGVYSGSGVSGNKFSPAGLNGNTIISYLYTGVNGCSSNSTDSIRVDSVTNVAFSLPDSMCFGAAGLNLNAAPIGGNYSLNRSVYSNSTYSGLLANTSDTIGYKYTNAFGCSDSTVENVRVDSITQVRLSSFGSVCEDDTINLINGFPLGGVYSGIGVIGSQYLRDTSGSWKITYSFTNQFGCVDSLDSNVIVRAKPKLAFASAGLICENTNDFILKVGNPIGGVYTGVGIVNDTIFSPNLVGKGVHAITYTLKNSNACVDSINFTLTVDTVPRVGLDSFAFVCRNQGLVNLSGGTPNGGFYYGTNVIGTNQFDPSVGFGTHQLGYKFIDGKGCQDSLLKAIFVDTLLEITSAALEDICQNVGLIKLTKGNPIAGVYKGTGIQSDGQFNPKSVLIGLDSLYYVLESRCGIDSMKVKFNVLDAPKASLPPYGRICNAQEGLALTQGKPVGGLYFVDGIEASTLSARPGTVEVIYVLSNPTGCSDTASSNAQYYSNPEITVVGDKAVCAGDSARFRVKENLATYVWNGDTASAEYFLKAEDMILGENVVKLTAIDSLGCSSEMSVKVNSTLCGFSMKLRPNPSDGKFALQINSGTEQEIDIAIWNTQGQRISGFNTVLIAGKNEFLYKMLDSAPGMYILEILIGQDLVIEKFVIK